MMITKVLLSVLLMLSAAMIGSWPAAAHVLIRDDSGTVAAVFHVTPDDDPIAGEASTLYFSFQNASSKITSANIFITDESGTTAELRPSLSANSFTTEYVFPERGIYSITLRIVAEKNYTFNHSQRISRGIGSGTMPDYPLAKATLIFSSVVLLAGVVFIINHRKQIVSQSTFR